MKTSTTYLKWDLKMNNKYALFIGRWQCLHMGHMHIFYSELNKGNNLLIAIRDVTPDANNPFDSIQVHKMLEIAFINEIKSGRVKLVIIPDIKSVNYGRGVGYEINEIIPPTHISNISATHIRSLIENGSDEWKHYIQPNLIPHLPKMYKNAAFFKSKIKMNFLSKSILKAISYRILGTGTTIGISYIITSRADMSFAIGGIEVFIKIFNYVVHEHIWKKLCKNY